MTENITAAFTIGEIVDAAPERRMPNGWVLVTERLHKLFLRDDYWNGRDSHRELAIVKINNGTVKVKIDSLPEDRLPVARIVRETVSTDDVEADTGADVVTHDTTGEAQPEPELTDVEKQWEGVAAALGARIVFKDGKRRTPSHKQPKGASKSGNRPADGPMFSGPAGTGESLIAKLIIEPAALPVSLVDAPAPATPHIQPKFAPPAPKPETKVVESVNGFVRKQVVTGTVSAIKEGLGAFVKLDKQTTGLAHHGDELGLTVGDEVLVYLSKVDSDSGKVSLRVITPEEQAFFETVKKGDEFEGTVASSTETGLRVDVGAAVGFLHESKILGGNRKEREQRRTTTAVGAVVSVTVLSVDKPHYELRFVERETASTEA